MAQTAPSFQNFVRRTPPVLDGEKPLPARPLLARRASTNSSSRSRSRSKTNFSYRGRRSSSIYSRTVSQWDSDRISWTSADFADEPVPPLPLLRPLAYSASTPQLVEKQVNAPVFQPRTFSPLIRTPSATTTSQVNTPAATQEVRDSFFPVKSLPSEPQALQPQKKHVRTISLEEAKAAINAPGAVHLLPEELRAKQFRRSRSDEALREVNLQGPDKPATAKPSEPLTLVDRQGRRRTILSPRDSFAFVAKHPLALAKCDGPVSNFSFHMGAKPQNSMVPVATQQREASENKVIQALGLDEFDEPRGRTRNRGPRNLNYEHYLRNAKRVAEHSSSRNEPLTQTAAQEYHALLTEQHSKQSDLTTHHTTESDDKMKTYLNMIPQPLFHTTPLAKPTGRVDRNDKDQDITPYDLSPATLESGDSDRESEIDPELHPLTIPRDTQHKRCSTSGTIPISPPEPLGRSFTVQSSRSGVSEISHVTNKKKTKMDSRVSAYYPHVASRKKTKAKRASKYSAQQSEIPPMPLLFSRTDTLSIESGSYETSPSSFHARPLDKFRGNGKSRKGSDASSKRSRPPLHQRVVKGAMDILTHHDMPESDSYEPITAATVSEGSPHLLPSPVKSRPKEVHLGWSDVAKNTFDRVTSPTKTPPKAVSPPVIDIETPARPLEKTNTGLSEAGPPRRKGSIFGTILDSWKESKAERRREELKKMIKFVPFEEEQVTAEAKRRSSMIGWM